MSDGKAWRDQAVAWLRQAAMTGELTALEAVSPAMTQAYLLMLAADKIERLPPPTIDETPPINTDI
jgi:hypothetical protein